MLSLQLWVDKVQGTVVGGAYLWDCCQTNPPRSLVIRLN